MSRKASAAAHRAKEDAKEAKNVLAAHGVTFCQSIVAKQRRADGFLAWTVRSDSRMEVWPRGEGPKGRWYLEVDIVYDLDELSDSNLVFVRKGTLGLSWERTTDAAPRSFVRYDLDARNLGSTSDPCHLNVLQPEPLKDRVHFRVAGAGLQEWPLRPTLEFLCSADLRGDLVKAVGGRP